MKKLSFHYGWVVLFSGFLTVLGAHGFGRFAYSIILPQMKESLNLDYFQMGLIASSNFIGYLTLATIGGLLASRYGPRTVISISAALMGITMVLTGFSTIFEHALITRLLTGLGNGGAYLPAMTLPSIWFASKLRGRATGIVSSGAGVGLTLSGILVPLIILGYGVDGWRYSWYYLGAVLLFIAVFDYFFLRNKPDDLGIEPVGSKGIHKTKISSVLNWNLVYRNKAILFVGLVYLMFGFSYIIYVTFFIAYLQDIGWTQDAAISLWFIVGVLTIFSGPFWGWVSDALGRKYAMALAFSVMTIAFLLFSFTPTILGLYTSAILFGISLMSVPTVAVVAAAEYVISDLRSAAAGFVTFFFGIGQIFGPSVAGFVIDTTLIFSNIFLIASVVSIIGALGSLALKKPRI